MGKIPNRLIQPPSAIVHELPVETKLQELPYDKIAWENFEKLCLRLVLQECEIEDCRQYGVQGDAQEGIDIYAKKESAEKYTVYQCRRVQNFGPQKIINAISTFLMGDWVYNTEKFVLCTQERLNFKKREDEIIAQRKILNEKSISLKIWDKHGLDSELKKYPQLVYDFFGREWVKAFCGDEAINNIKVSAPLPDKKKYKNPNGYISRRIIAFTNSELHTFFEQGESITKILEKENRISLLGWAGTGKSFELQRLAYELSLDNNPYFPFLIKLNIHTEKSIQDYIPEITKIPQNAIVLCLDGLDEVQVGSFNSVSRKIMEFGVAFPKVKIVVSCRSNFYTTVLENEGLSTLQGFKSFTLANLNSKEVENYLEKKLHLKKNSFLQEIQDKSLESILYIPYYLIKLSEQYLKNNRISNSKTELFAEVIEENIKKDVARYFPDKREALEREMRMLLEKLAFVLEYQGKNHCTWEQLQKCFKEKELTIIKSAGSLLDGNEGLKSVWKFNHNNIQEYLAAIILSKRTFEEVKKVIGFQPSFKKVKPTWVNTLSFLISILISIDKLGEKLLSWLIKNEPELVVQFEPDKLDNVIRHQTFIKIFSFYKKEKRSINRTKFNSRELSKFSMCEKTLGFLNQELQLTQPISSRGNALGLISYYRIETDFSSQREQIKHLIEQNVYEPKSTLTYLSIKAYVEIFDLDSKDFKRLMNTFSESQNTWIRFIIFYAIHKQGFQDQYIDYVISKIKKIINKEIENNDRLSNEYSELKECIKCIKSVESVNRVVDFILDDYGTISYSVYFTEIIEYILNLIAKSYPTDEILFKKIKLAFSSEIMSINDKQVKQFIQYFEKTGNRARAFKELYDSNSDDLKYHILNQLALLADEEAIKLFASEFKNSRIEKRTVEDFQYRLEQDNPNLKLFNQLINEKEEILLPIYRDYDKETMERNEKTKELLFSKDNFKKAIEQIFIDEGKNELSYDEIWEIQKSEFQGKYLPIVYETTRLYDKHQTRNKTKLLEWIEGNWEPYSISKIIGFLKNVKETKFSEDQIAFITKWCDKKSKQVDFKNALSHPDLNTTSANRDAIKLSFLIRRLDLRDYSTELFLDMLSFQRWDDNEINIFDFVEKVVPKDQMDVRVLKNLSDGIAHHMVLDAHLDYCVKHKLYQSCTSLISYLKDNDYIRYKVLDTYLELNGDLSQLERLLPNIMDDFRYKLIQRLIQKNSKTVSRLLLYAFKSEENDDAKLRLADCLIQLQNMKGVNFYINYVKRNKVIPDNSSLSNSFDRLSSTKFLKQIFNLYEMGFNEEIKQDVFSNLKDIAISALMKIGLHNDNFPKTKRLFALYKIKFKVMTFLKLHKLPEIIVLNLKHYFENMEHQYYVNKSLNIDLKEALNKYSIIG
ncbi:MAG: hypothetical protein HQ541_12175 [Mariniphaga sp.]|nr:hypothetical protein [Mariniphaga sp.]